MTVLRDFIAQCGMANMLLGILGHIYGPESRLRPNDKDKINLASFKESIWERDLTVLLEDNCSNCILCNLNY